ncbi:uncharacterized protein LOC144148214 [Haemaphysalis longicornis]
MWSACNQYLEVATSWQRCAREANPAWAAWPLYLRTMLKSLIERAFCPQRHRQRSTVAELAGKHLAADMLREDPPPASTIFCDSRPALLRLREASEPWGRRGHLEMSLVAKLRDLQGPGWNPSLQWLPTHVGIPGNEAPDDLAKATHHCLVAPVSTSLVRHDARYVIRRDVAARHPCKRATPAEAPRLLPTRGISQTERSLNLLLLTGPYNTAACLHRQGHKATPICAHCPDPKTLDHVQCSCPAYAGARNRLVSGYRWLGLP